MQSVVEAAEFIGDDEFACRECGGKTREWELPASVNQPPSGYAERPDASACPRCWVKWAAETWAAIEADEKAAARA